MEGCAPHEAKIGSDLDEPVRVTRATSLDLPSSGDGGMPQGAGLPVSGAGKHVFNQRRPLAPSLCGWTEF